jgi:hypothetical protein
MTQVTTRIARQPFLLDAAAIEAAATAVLPEPLVDRYVVVGGRRYPPKQVIALATGLDRADLGYGPNSACAGAHTVRPACTSTPASAAPCSPPDPAQVTRLTEIIENHTARLIEAHQHG